jgi:hypothetical protein
MAAPERGGGSRVSMATSMRLWLAAVGASLLWGASAEAQGEGPPIGLAKECVEEAGGTMLVLSRKPPAVFRVDPQSGDREIVADNDHGAGPRFVGLTSLDVEADGSILVLDGVAEVPVLLRIDPVAGDRTILSGGSQGTGPALQTPGAVRVEEDASVLVLDQDMNAVYRIDPVTGDRVVVSSTPSSVLEMQSELYFPGENITASSVQLVNLAPDPRSLRLEIYLEDPLGGRYSIVDRGQDGSSVIPEKTVREFGQHELLRVDDQMPAGDWTLWCKLYEAEGAAPGEILEAENVSFSVATGTQTR